MSRWVSPPYFLVVWIKHPAMPRARQSRWAPGRARTAGSPVAYRPWDHGVWIRVEATAAFEGFSQPGASKSMPARSTTDFSLHFERRSEG